MPKFVFDDSETFGKWLAVKLGNTGSWGDFYAMGVLDDNGVVMAAVVVNDYNTSNAAVHIGLERVGKWLPAFLFYVCDYCFRHCGLKRITGLVPASNTKALKFDLHVGFEQEFIMRCGAPDGGDQHVLVMWADKCPWLKRIGDGEEVTTTTRL